MFNKLTDKVARYILIGMVSCSCLAAATPQLSQPYYPSKSVARLTPHASGTVVVNAASYLPGVSPGGLATAFGANLSDVNGTIVAGTNPFPLVLADVSVTVNGVPAPIFSVAYAGGQDQISFQVPWGTITGIAAANVKVYDYGQKVADVVVDSFTEDPGIFAFTKYGNQYAVALHSVDYSLITPDNPTYRGEAIILYTTGLGAVDTFIRDGYGAPSNPLANTKNFFRVLLAGREARLYFSGLAPGFVGLYQINLQIPNDVPAGDLTLKIYSEYADSQTVYLSVR